jgi:DNA repair protein RecO (recombination protein O)
MTPPGAELFIFLPFLLAMSQTERLYRTPAVILSRRDYGEADRVLTVFTPGLGKQEFLAKGIRKTTSRKAGHLELLTHSTLLVAKARTWDIITEAASVESFRALRTNLDAIGYASFLCELVDCFTESDDDNQPLWDLFLLALRVLDEYGQQAPAQQPQIEPQLLLHWFQLQLLALTGFQPQFFYCLACQEALTPVTNYLSLEDGGVYCPRCGTIHDSVEAIEADVLKMLRHIQRSSWPELQSVRIRPPVQQAIDTILNRYLLTIVERQLKAVNFLRRLRAMTVTPVHVQVAV